MVEDILHERLPEGVKVWVFGSRAEWTTKESSDLDIALEGDGPLDSRMVMALDLAFEESLLPFRVDLVDLARVEDRFREIVLRGRVVLMEGRTDSLTHFGWCSQRLGDISLKIGSGATPRGGKAVYRDAGPCSLIRSQNVLNNRFSWDGLAFIDQAQADELSNVEVLPEDVLLNITGDSVARVCQVDPDALPARVNQHVAILRPDPEQLDPRFLRYFLVSPAMQSKLLSWAGSGGTRKALTKGMIESFEVPAPQDIREQRAIARLLGSLDDKVELNRRMNETLEAMARAIFKSWFVDFDPVRAKMEGRDTGLPPDIADLFPDRLVDSELGQIPEGWDTTTLGDLCEPPQYGFTASASNDPIGPRFLRITDINKRSWITWEDVPYCAISSSDLAKYRLHRGDILIARMADPGHGVLVEDDELAVFASYLIRFRPFAPAFARFLQYWLRSRGYWDLVSGRFSGTTRMNINARQLRSLPLVVPSGDAVETFASQINTLRAFVVSRAKETSCLTQVRDTMLPKLVRGEIRLPAAVIKRYGETATAVAT